MRAGELDRLIVIEEPTATRGSSGSEIETWDTFAEVWAGKRDIRPREIFASQQVLAEEMTVFRIRWLDGVTTQMRISDDGKLYGIEGIAELGRHEGIELAAKALTV